MNLQCWNTQKALLTVLKICVEKIYFAPAIVVKGIDLVGVIFVFIKKHYPYQALSKRLIAVSFTCVNILNLEPIGLSLFTLFYCAY